MKEHWTIDQFGEPINVSGLSRLQLEKLHRLGNDFPSKNATVKAVEKLKAWNRLKDKGFRFIPEASYIEGGTMFIACTMNDYRDFVFGDNADIKMLFGGEE